MIVDMPPGTGDSYISMAKQFDIAGVILVSTPQKLAVIDLVRSFDSFDKLNIPIIGIIENMSYLNIKKINYFALIINKILNKNIINKRIANKIKIFGDKALVKIANQHKIEVIANIPIDKNIDSANEFGIPVLISRPKSTVSKLFNQLAIKLIKDGINN
jgi:ATP-binding protein involved in chromosome partitioning